MQTRRNETLQVTLTGTHFAPEAKLIIDGKPGGSISRINAEQLIGIINHAEHFFGTHTLGVLNPDGTAAQIAFRVHHYGDDDIATPTSGY